MKRGSAALSLQGTHPCKGVGSASTHATRRKAALGVSPFGVTPLFCQQFFAVIKMLDCQKTGFILENISKVAPNPRLFGS